MVSALHWLMAYGPDVAPALVALVVVIAHESGGSI